MLSEAERLEPEAPRGQAPEAEPANEPRAGTGASTRVPSAPYWLLVRGRGRQAHGLEIFTFVSGAEKALPVFGSEEEASAFVQALADRGEWWARKTGGGELLSVLSSSGYSAGPCANVEKVTLAPSPAMAEGSGTDPRVVSMNRRCFMEHLMGRGRAWFDGTHKG